MPLLDSVWTNAILESSSASASALRNAADHSIWIGSYLRPSESLPLGRSQRFDCGGELYEVGLSSYTLLLAGSILANLSGWGLENPQHWVLPSFGHWTLSPTESVIQLVASLQRPRRPMTSTLVCCLPAPLCFV